MGSFIRYAISCIEKITGMAYLSAPSAAVDFPVPSQNCALMKKRLEKCFSSYHHRQVGILYADIADYSRLTEQDEEATHLRLVERMNLVEAHVVANNGRVAHFAGDAILAEFDDADNALNCAINMQISDRRKNACLAAEEQILLRIGVHFGDVIADRGDIYGNVVNLTARLEQHVRCGGICVSEPVRRRLKNNPSFKFVATN